MSNQQEQKQLFGNGFPQLTSQLIEMLNEHLPTTMFPNRMVEGVNRGCKNDIKIKQTVVKYTKIKVPGIEVVDSKMDYDENMIATIKCEPSSFTCCVCADKIKGSIIRCVNAHPLCSECVIGIELSGGKDECPICRVKTRYRALELEMIRDTFIIKCKKHLSGCTFHGFPEQVNDHGKKCAYAIIKCVWCNNPTDTIDMNLHLLTDCKIQFSEMVYKDGLRLSNNLLSIGTIINSNITPSLMMYVYKSADCYEFMTVDGKFDSSNGLRSVTMTYDVASGSFDGVMLYDSRSVCLPIHTPETFIKGQKFIHKITATDMKSIKNLKVSGFYHKYRVGEEYIVMKGNNGWYMGTVLEIDIKEDRILIEFKCTSVSCKCTRKVCQWIKMENGETKHIRTIKEQKFIDTQHDTYNNMSDTDRMKLVMELSVDDQ
jgi:hypothetical protein